MRCRDGASLQLAHDLASDDLDVIEIDAASNTGVDNVREIIENARYRPVSARTSMGPLLHVRMKSRSYQRRSLVFSSMTLSSSPVVGL